MILVFWISIVLIASTYVRWVSFFGDTGRFLLETGMVFWKMSFKAAAGSAEKA